MSQAIPAQRPLGELLTPRQKFIVFNSLILCGFLTSLDSSIVATAMPRILADLGGFSLLSWVFTAYLLATTIAIPIVGRPSDMFGRKPFIIAGVLIFVLASAAAGAAPSMPFLIGARAVQGIGGGIIQACVFASIGDIFTPIQRAKYVGYIIGVFTIAAVTGPAIGGLLTDGPGWRWAFYLNVPVGVVALALVWVTLPHSRKGGKLSSVDFLGAALLSAATTSLMLALVWGTEEFGWASKEAVGLFAGAAILGVAFLFQERRHPQAILPMFLFRNRVYVHAILIILVSRIGMFGAVQYLPTFIQTAMGASATISGLITIPQSLGLFVASVAAGQLVARTGRYRYPITFGACLATAAMFLLHTVRVGDPEWHIAAFMVLLGLGSGVATALMSAITMSAVSQEFQGVATSGRIFSLHISQVLGVAIFGVIFTTSYSSAFSANASITAISEISPAVYRQFEDPTLAIDPQRLAEVRDQVLRLPDGEAILDEAVSAQKQAVTAATDRMFLGATLGGILLIALAITMKEMPLRATFASDEPSSDEPAGERAGPLEPVSGPQ